MQDFRRSTAQSRAYRTHEEQKQQGYKTDDCRDDLAFRERGCEYPQRRDCGPQQEQANVISHKRKGINRREQQQEQRKQQGKDKHKSKQRKHGKELARDNTRNAGGRGDQEGLHAASAFFGNDPRREYRHDEQEQGSQSRVQFREVAVASPHIVKGIIHSGNRQKQPADSIGRGRMQPRADFMFEQCPH